MKDTYLKWRMKNACTHSSKKQTTARAPQNPSQATTAPAAGGCCWPGAGLGHPPPHHTTNCPLNSAPHAHSGPPHRKNRDDDQPSGARSGHTNPGTRAGNVLSKDDAEYLKDLMEDFNQTVDNKKNVVSFVSFVSYCVVVRPQLCRYAACPHQ